MLPGAPLSHFTSSAVAEVRTGAGCEHVCWLCRGAVDKDAIMRGAGVASSSRYGSVIAGTLVAAVVIVGIAGTVLVWRRRAGAYQGLHDTEMAMIRREH